ncbi:RGS domain-containing serine/threonine-protein kinase A-like [Mercenaria mercenaria]|uniref:RGS domain-containing serine/threonine-protein kinase A-like n=1 Tax=Mercenaria mercenaria TaxID=6596 RepID=UPI00234F0771|nr:RGS domain-containing serine/threonine-protein kinase A-like [Mercenaria mercenaria]XP_045216406.2 RGS domain-containing serine/threonine-protein kinase A-like [Mercenaria mercenaria]
MALISVDDIGLYRTGPNNDIDLQAVYGGRLSGKRERDLKVNPVYSDVNNANQYSDINGNMSPVHVVTYESFPRTRKKTLTSENGKIQNGDIVQSVGKNWAESNNNNISHSAVVENFRKDIEKDKNDANHDSEIEAKNLQLNEKSNDTREDVQVQCKNSNKASSELLSNQNDSRANTEEIPHATEDVHTKSDKGLQTKGFLKNYGLLGYNNESFVLDGIEVVIESKQTEDSDPKHSLSTEIHNNNNSGKSEIPGSKTESLKNSDANHVNPKTVSDSKEILPEVTDSKENSQTEISVATSDLPESAYQEISDLCDFHEPISEDISKSNGLIVNTDDNLSNLCESPQICHKEIVTEVLVHNSAVLDTPTKHYISKYSESDTTCHSFDLENNPVSMSYQTDSSDWPDMDVLVRQNEDETYDPSMNEIAQTNESEVECQGHVRSISDVVIQEKETNEGTDNTGNQSSDGNLEGFSLYKKKQNKSNSSSKPGVVSEAGSSTRTLKSILSNGSSHYSCTSECEHKRQNSDLEIHELKTVKFSEDTVFNENKSNKYKKEKFGQINLRELYRGKIMNDAAVAKLNPLYQPEQNDIEVEEEGDTNNEKLTYQLTLKNAMRLSKGKTSSLNGPSYMEQYLILKAHGIKKDDIDIEKLPETMEKPVYDRLIQRTLAKERRKFCVKWSMVIITVAVITAVATTLGVYFKEGF